MERQHVHNFCEPGVEDTAEEVVQLIGKLMSLSDLVRKAGPWSLCVCRAEYYSLQ